MPSPDHDDADGAREVEALLDTIPGAHERAHQGLLQARANDTVTRRANG